MSESKVAIYVAIAANVAIATTKFIVAGVTGSSAMLSEGIHSTVDTGNGVLLLVGLRPSQRPPSELHPYGHGNIVSTVRAIQAFVRHRFPVIRRIYFEAGCVVQAARGRATA